ncbi:MAG: hypothetical protein HKO57_05870 [Akkermansiaceae bacterium]|nr:hypothetical protein [Akkermansiaceae bacterium]
MKLLQILLPLVILFVHGLVYNGIGEIAAARGVDYGPLLKIPLDAHIPLVPVFVLAYLLVWFFPLALIAVVAWERGLDPAPFRRLSVELLALMLTCYALWIVFPVSVDLRVEDSALERHGWLGELVGFNYGRASLWNACPSFHVAGPWLLCRALPPSHRAWRVIFWAAVAAIMASTVLIRIHYLLDIVFGVAVAEVVHHLVRRRWAST